MMKKSFISLLGMFSAFTVLLTACGGGTQTQPSQPSQAAPDPAASQGPGESAAELPELELELGHPGSASEENHMHFFAVRFQEEAAALSGGKIKINIHPASELGGEREMLEGVQLGTLDMCFTSTGPLGNFVPEVYAFDFPFLFKDYDHAQKVFDGEIGDQFRDKVREQGIEVVVWAENGIRQLLNNERPIVTAADMKGLKIRTMENKVHMETFRVLGADPTPISTAELYTALQQGVVDAMEGPITWMIPAKFYEIQKYLTVSNHLYAPSILAMNAGQFAEYPPEVQELLTKAAQSARDKQRAYLKDADAKLLETARENGVEVVENADFDRQSFIDATKPVYDQLGKDYQGVIDQIRALE